MTIDFLDAHLSNFEFLVIINSAAVKYVICFLVNMCVSLRYVSRTLPSLARGIFLSSDLPDTATLLCTGCVPDYTPTSNV